MPTVLLRPPAGGGVPALDCQDLPHLRRQNPFTVLQEIGGECAGAVSLVQPGGEPPFASAPDAVWLTETQLASLLSELPSRPLLSGPEDEEGVRLSLAGTRDKLPILIDG